MRVPRARRWTAVVGLSVLVLAGACAGGGASDGGADGGAVGGRDGAGPPAGGACASEVAPRRWVPRVVRELPHDPEAFTQGLDEHEGVLYESTGLVGRSSLRAVDPSTGEVLATRRLDDVFAEGLTWSGDELVQLTWKDGVAFRWRAADAPERGFEPAGRFRYRGEGWGLAALDDGTLAMSDGSDSITERDPGDFSVLRTWTVQRVGGDADRLNELEWDGERLWANRWGTDELLGIDPVCRRVDVVVDASELTERARDADGGSGIDVLNGIAHLAGTERYLVTGKLWPVMFEVELGPA